MLIQALCSYADLRERSRTEKEIPDGWCEQDVHFKINLSPQGELVSIDDIRDEKKIIGKNGKEKTVLVAKKATLPTRTQKTCIDSNTIEHRPLYIFGLEYGQDAFVESSKAQKSHSAFVAHELAFFEGLDSPACLAIGGFWSSGTQKPKRRTRRCFIWEKNIRAPISGLR